MIGGMIENLKHPKNAISAIVAAYVAVFLGYLWTVHIGRWEWVGAILGSLGLVALCFTIVRVSLTRLWLGVILGALIVVYAGWYMRSTRTKAETIAFDREEAPWQRETRSRRRPRFAKTGFAQIANEAIFAPAYMFDSTFLRRSKWRTRTDVGRSGWTAPNK